MGLGEHLADMVSGLSTLDPLDVALGGALGSQLGADVVSPRPIPHFPLCARAGYAVRSSDAAAHVSLRIVDDVAPGFTSSQPVYAGVCVAVAEGAMLPKGSDAVVSPSDVTRSGDTVTLAGPVAAGAGVAAIGSVAPRGAVLLAAGRTVDPGAVGLIAAAGLSRVPVRPRPRVVVVSVGNGLVSASGPATDGLQFDSGGPMLAAAAAQVGAMSSHVGPVLAEERPLRDAIEDQLIRSDLLVVIGGSEPGESGVRSYLTASGTVRYEEGSTSLGAFGHGILGDEKVPVVALPAHPARAAMLFHVVAVPIVRAMRGAAPLRPMTVVLAQDVPRRPGVTTLLLARIRPDGRADPVLRDDPTVADYAAADAIVRVLPGEGVMIRGSRVPAIAINGDDSDEH